MLTTDFDYHLPPELIAQTPAEPRDSSRLMVVNRANQKVEHKTFRDVENFLQAGDVLVWNNSKVFKARLIGEIVGDENVLTVGQSDGKPHPTSPQKGEGDILPRTSVEIFLVRPMENPGVWKVLAKPGRKLRLGMKIKFADLSAEAPGAKADDFECEVLIKEKDGTVLVQFADSDAVVREKANKYGSVPLPPYVASKHENIKTQEQYQTVYAKHEGSVAAPTAGFHFTPELIERLNKKGVQFAEVTLHVGLGTFLPVKSQNVEEHQMHSEWVELTDKNASIINAAKAEGRRVVAVGTTTVRTLEGVWNALNKVALDGSGKVSSRTVGGQLDQGGGPPLLHAYNGDINIFITPGFLFHIVDALITNFHLPKSTLVMLVSSFMGQKMSNPDDGRLLALSCYNTAIVEKYRFYSFGDAMFII